MPDIKIAYDGLGESAITCTAASLADGGYRESTAIDNTSDLFIDALVGGQITVGTSPTADRQIFVYAYGSVGGTTKYSGNASGSDADYTNTANQADNLRLIGVIATDNTSDHTYEFGGFSVAQAFGGILPPSWGIVIRNDTGAALNSTGGNHDINYQGVYLTST